MVILLGSALEMATMPADTNRKETGTTADCSRKLN